MKTALIIIIITAVIYLLADLYESCREVRKYKLHDHEWDRMVRRIDNE